MQLSQQVVVKYPLRIRVAACLFCALTAPLFVKSSVLIAIIVESVALCAAIWVLWYRVGISGAEISIRYFPFIAKHIPTQEVSEVIQQRALVLVTRKCRISLWGLPTSTGEAIIRLLPNRLQSNEDAEQSSRDNWTKRPVWTGKIKNRKTKIKSRHDHDSTQSQLAFHHDQ